MAKPQCLIIDDDEDSLFIAEHIFRSLRFDTHTAKDGQKGYTLCSVVQPDIVILDWHMPGMEGIDFLKKISKKEEGEKPMRIIMCTGENEAARVREAISHGVDGYIVKPYRREDIVRQLRALGMYE